MPELKLIYNIVGIGAASGLVFEDQRLFVLSDNSSFLYQFDPASLTLEKIKLFEDSSENIIKKKKPDFEAIASYHGNLYLFGSGSTKKRKTMVQVDSATKQVVATYDLKDLYKAMRKAASIEKDEFNIEGACFDGKSWLLVNRGNGPLNKNLIFIIDGIELTNTNDIQCFEYQLPLINGIRASFTDAVLIESKIYFIATAENTISTYDDGAVHGSLIGRIDRHTMELDFTEKVSDTLKIEGLTLFSESERKLEFLVCEDNDTEALESSIYKLTIDTTALNK